ncbi:unnamed protein product, partial [Didymodactylos carnosus]
VEQRRQKVARSRSDDEDMDTPMNDDQSTCPKTPKTARYSGPHQEKIYINRNLQRRFNEQEYINPGQYSEQILISDQAIAHSVDTRLPMIRIQCSPALRSKETGVQFIKDFMKYIESNFRVEYPGHKDPIGLDQWWLQGDGNFLCGVTDDIDFYMYLCDDSHYPFSIGNVQIKLEPSKQLTVQNSVIIKTTCSYREQNCSLVVRALKDHVHTASNSANDLNQTGIYLQEHALKIISECQHRKLCRKILLQPTLMFTRTMLFALSKDKAHRRIAVDLLYKTCMILTGDFLQNNEKSMETFVKFLSSTPSDQSSADTLENVLAAFGIRRQLCFDVFNNYHSIHR